MVNYVTKRPKRERFGEAYVTGGSFNHKEVGFDFGDNLTGDETLSYRLTGKFRIPTPNMIIRATMKSSSWAG